MKAIVTVASLGTSVPPGETDTARAARRIRNLGPGIVVVKRGEDGAVLFADDWVFHCPACSVERVVDPTGAGDAFAGGFLGHLDRVGSYGREELARAVMHGSAMGSYAVEAFSVDRFRDLDPRDIAGRVEGLRAIATRAPELARAVE